MFRLKISFKEKTSLLIFLHKIGGPRAIYLKDQYLVLAGLLASSKVCPSWENLKLAKLRDSSPTDPFAR
jgi:hypothetical protein